MVVLATALLVTQVAGPAQTHVVRGYGMSITIPRGWHGRITHGLVRVSGGGLRFEIRESTPEARPNPFFRRRAAPTLRKADFRAVEHHLGFSLAGRQFAVLPFRAQRAAPAAIRTANMILRSFTARRGRFYGQRL